MARISSMHIPPSAVCPNTPDSERGSGPGRDLAGKLFHSTDIKLEKRKAARHYNHL